MVKYKIFYSKLVLKIAKELYILKTGLFKSQPPYQKFIGKLNSLYSKYVNIKNKKN